MFLHHVSAVALHGVLPLVCWGLKTGVMCDYGGLYCLGGLGGICSMVGGRRQYWGFIKGFLREAQHLLQPDFTSTAGWECSGNPICHFYLTNGVTTHHVSWLRVGLEVWEGANTGLQLSVGQVQPHGSMVKCLRVVGWAPLSLLF